MSNPDEKETLWRKYYELVLENEHRAAFECLQELSNLDPDDQRVHAEISALLVELGEVPLDEDEDDASSESGAEDIEVVCFDSVPEIFASLPEENLDILERGGIYRTYSPGDAVFSEGDMGDSMFIIKSGKALVTVNAAGEPLVVATLGDGDFFGEMALLSRRPRTASVTALGELMVMEIPRDALKPLVSKHADIPSKLAEYFNRRAQDSREKLDADNKSQSGQSSAEFEI